MSISRIRRGGPRRELVAWLVDLLAYGDSSEVTAIASRTNPASWARADTFRVSALGGRACASRGGGPCARPHLARPRANGALRSPLSRAARDRVARSRGGLGQGRREGGGGLPFAIPARTGPFPPRAACCSRTRRRGGRRRCCARPRACAKTSVRARMRRQRDFERSRSSAAPRKPARRGTRCCGSTRERARRGSSRSGASARTPISRPQREGRILFGVFARNGLFRQADSLLDRMAGVDSLRVGLSGKDSSPPASPPTCSPTRSRNRPAGRRI